jgi:hypothetical protein
MSSPKLQSLLKLIKLMKARSANKTKSVYKQGAQTSGMAGYLPQMKDGGNMSLQRQKINKAKPYDRIEKDK